ncbi:MAG: hypothetical protein POH28_01395 [Acidocella sp.]|nr:hypothetical protein [Acidocella sp.]
MSTGATQPFRPAGTASAAASTSVATIGLVGGGGAVLVYNASNATAFFRLGGATALTATGADTPVPAGGRILVGGGPFVSHAAVVLASGSGTVYFTLGDGDTY